MRLALVAAIAFGLTAVLIPLFAGWSRRVGLVDLPNARKIHDQPVPLVGGLAIYSGVLAALLAGGYLEGQILLLLLASLAVLVLGALDDRLDLRSTHRLAVQILLAALLCSVGVRFHFLGLEPLDWALTIVWMVGAINAFNCIDCADGMAGSASLVAFAYFGVTAAQNRRDFVAQAAVAGAAAVIAFLCYNRPKARVFMGDTGSTFLGLMLASLAILCMPKPAAAPEIPWPALALAVPFYDIVLVHVRRYRGGLKSLRHLLASTGKDHLPHRLLEAGLGPWRSLLVMGLLSLLPATAAWSLTLGRGMLCALILVLLSSVLWHLEGGSMPALSRDGEPPFPAPVRVAQTFPRQQAGEPVPARGSKRTGPRS